MKPSIKRIWHPYWLWEETKYNMWGSVTGRYSYLQNAIAFMEDTKEFGKYMMQVVDEWEYSCEHNLSNIESNRRAWIGQAAVALNMKCPESITRDAWKYLNEDQQKRANEEADKAIKHWEKIYVKKTTK